MAENMLLAISILIMYAVSTANLISAAVTDDVKLITHPEGPYISALEGEPFNVSCEGVNGEESKFSSIQWLNSEGKAIPEGNPSVVTSENKLFLTFNDPKITDSGTYGCSAVYDSETKLKQEIFLEFYAKLRIDGMKPEFDLTFENVSLVAGQRDYLQCLARGEKPITYSWYNQEEDKISKDDSNPIYATDFEDSSLLNFEKLRVEHEGTYTCTARNTHGLASKVYLLRVINPSDDNDTDPDNGTSQFGFAKVVSLTARSVHFYINTTGPVKYIELKYREKRGASNQTTRLSPTPVNLYKIGNLVPSGLYTFQFRTVPSENDNWSRDQEVLLLPDAPEIIFQNVDRRTVKLEIFRTITDILRGTIDKHQIKYFTVQINSENGWISRNCIVTIEIPKCFGSSYTISGLQQRVYYQIEVRAHTAAGYGEPTAQKIYLTD